jgi:catechol 2,3-dioxygenase-like lactoylglutathione lyase family enzyme
METRALPPSGIRGLWHLALRVTDLSRSRAFYEGLGMRPVWQPDPDNLYLSTGTDNLALHQIPASELASYRQAPSGQFLDHFGIVVDTPETVDGLCAQAERFGAAILHPPKKHRDGSYSCYLSDPDGNTVQILYEPTISKLEVRRKP